MVDTLLSRTAYLSGDFDLQFWGTNHANLIDEKEYSGGFLSFADSSFEVDAPVYENSSDAAYDNTYGNYRPQWEVPDDEVLVSLGTLSYTNNELEDDFGRSVPNHGANFKLTLDDPVAGTFSSNFYLTITNRRDEPETLQIGFGGRDPKQLQILDPDTGRGTGIFLDFMGAREIGASEDTPLKYSFDVPDNTTAQFEFFGRLFSTEDFPNPVRITSISDDTGVAGDDFVTSDNTLVFNGTAEAGYSLEFFLDDTSIGTTTVDGSGNWSYDYTGTVLPDGEYQVSAIASNPTKDTFISSAPQELTIDATPPDVEITSISEDTGIPDDFRTSDNTLVFNGTAEPLSEVEVFLEGGVNQSNQGIQSIGTVVTDANGDWSLDYTNVELVDGEYGLTATATDSAGNVATNNQTQPLKIDTDYDIELDFSYPSIANEQALQDQIRKAAEFWEGIILNDIPDVNDSAVGGLVDDLKIIFKVGALDGAGGTLAQASDYQTRLPNTSGGIDPLTGQPLSDFDRLPYHAVITIDEADLGSIGTRQFEQTLQHEIAHTIGFNSKTFAEKGFVKTINQNGKTYYGLDGTKAPNALQAYKDLGGKSTHGSVPLEDNDNTPAHWHEWLFPDGFGDEGFFGLSGFRFPGASLNDELMTTANPPQKYAALSKLTLGAFKDLGFTVDETKAENIQVFSTDTFLFSEYTNPLFDINY